MQALQFACCAAQAEALFAGGERSFTTLCFLLALACEVVSPFHALDEFDVFQVQAEEPTTSSTLDMHFSAAARLSVHSSRHGVRACCQHQSFL